MQEPSKQRRGLLERYLPHPLLTLALVALWVALINSFSFGVVLMGVVLGLIIPISTSHYWPERPKIKSPLRALAFVMLLIYDVAVANIQVAFLVLFRNPEKLRSRWVVVPLDLTSPEGITALAATITLTPGTVSSDFSADGRVLLVHCLDAADDQSVVDNIKQRYESRIKAIFS